MSVTPDKELPSKRISDMMSSPTNHFLPLRKMPKLPNMGNKPHYEESEATETDQC